MSTKIIGFKAFIERNITGSTEKIQTVTQQTAKKKKKKIWKAQSVPEHTRVLCKFWTFLAEMIFEDYVRCLT
jgi:hypothetical protein